MNLTAPCPTVEKPKTKPITIEVKDFDDIWKQVFYLSYLNEKIHRHGFDYGNYGYQLQLPQGKEFQQMFFNPRINFDKTIAIQAIQAIQAEQKKNNNALQDAQQLIQTSIEKIREVMTKIQAEFSNHFENLAPLYNDYEIIPTLYGPWGSRFAPSQEWNQSPKAKIYIRIDPNNPITPFRQRDPQNPTKIINTNDPTNIILTAMIWLAIQPYIKQKNLTQPAKMTLIKYLLQHISHTMLKKQEKNAKLHLHPQHAHEGLAQVLDNVNSDNWLSEIITKAEEYIAETLQKGETNGLFNPKIIKHQVAHRHAETKSNTRDKSPIVELTLQEYNPKASDSRLKTNAHLLSVYHLIDDKTYVRFPAFAQQTQVDGSTRTDIDKRAVHSAIIIARHTGLIDNEKAIKEHIEIIEGILYEKLKNNQNIPPNTLLSDEYPRLLIHQGLHTRRKAHSDIRLGHGAPIDNTPDEWWWHRANIRNRHTVNNTDPEKNFINIVHKAGMDLGHSILTNNPADFKLFYTDEGRYPYSIEDIFTFPLHLAYTGTGTDFIDEQNIQNLQTEFTKTIDFLKSIGLPLPEGGKPWLGDILSTINTCFGVYCDTSVQRLVQCLDWPTDQLKYFAIKRLVQRGKLEEYESKIKQFFAPLAPTKKLTDNHHEPLNIITALIQSGNVLAVQEYLSQIITTKDRRKLWSTIEKIYQYVNQRYLMMDFAFAHAVEPPNTHRFEDMKTIHRCVMSLYHNQEKHLAEIMQQVSKEIKKWTSPLPIFLYSENDSIPLSDVKPLLSDTHPKYNLWDISLINAKWKVTQLNEQNIVS